MHRPSVTSCDKPNEMLHSSMIATVWRYFGFIELGLYSRYVLFVSLASGSTRKIYDSINCTLGPDGNLDHSFLTMVSRPGLMFGIINIVGECTDEGHAFVM